MATSEAQLKANKKYQHKFDKVQIRVSHEEKAAIDQHAESMGESTNAFVRRAIAETISRDNNK
jgi:predicted HicB family RNase H-like nuclease